MTKTTSQGKKISVECWVPIAELADDWILRVIASVPEVFRPTHFSGSERFDKRRAKLVSDRDALRTWTRQYSSASLHADYMYVDVISWDKIYGCIHAYVKPVKRSHEVIRAWWQNLESLAFIYGKAASQTEHNHRHLAITSCINGLGGRVEQLIGRDYRRYIPGLYWLNYFSREYAEQHHIDIDVIAQKAQGSLETLRRGHILQLYDNPDDWTMRSVAIDSLLAMDTRFFSRQRATIPETIASRDEIELMRTVHEMWP